MNLHAPTNHSSNAKLALTALAVFIASIPLWYAAWKYGVHPALNILWIVAIPCTAAVLSKRSVLDRFMAAVLFAVSLLLGSGVTAALIGYP